MKKRNKVLALLLTGAMLAGSLVGCGNQTENKETQVSTTTETNKTSETVATTPSEPQKAAVTYPMDTDIELDIYLSGLASLNSVYSEHAESYWHSRIDDYTGIKASFAPRITDAAAEMMYISNEAEAPDLFCSNQRKIMEYVQDGIILDLTDYLPEYAPNYWEFINRPENEMIKRSVTTDDGRFYTFPGLVESVTNTTYMGPMIRQDWLDECGLKAPVTLEDWENVLVTFKEKYGATLSGMYSDFKNSGLCSGTDATAQLSALLVVEDGKVTFGNGQEEWKEYVDILAKWYDMGLIDADFFTADRNLVRQKAIEGKTGVTVSALSQLGNLIDDAKAENTGAEWVGLEYPRTAAGEPTSMIQLAFSNFTNTGNLSVSSYIDEEKIPVALAWCDYWFTEEGNMFANFGVEGETYTIKDGEPQFTDMVMKDEGGINQAITKYVAWNGAFIGPQKESYLKAKFAEMPAVVDALYKWVDNSEARERTMPMVVLTEDELADYNDNWNAINTYVSENVAKHIKGEAKIDWDVFYKEIEKMGLEKCIAAYQSAYDRFMSK
ncbi:MAG: extracellular solute-binding protein [Lachnospiraceae bacterium]|nr:extracellular solute-binding protein [Lachnospiraceae bacterium]